MEDFSTYQGAVNVFANVSCVGAENCIIGAVVDQSKSTSFTASMVGNAFGPAGYVAGNVIGRERDLRVSRIYDYLFALLNFTESGVGVIPLVGGGLRINPANLRPSYEGFVFYYYQELSGVSVKKFFMVRKTVRTITIKLAGGYKLQFTANMAEKALPYQINGMNKLVERFQ